jgi:hypothetical protein
MKSIFASKTFAIAVIQAIIGAVLALDPGTSVYLGIALVLKSVLDIVIRFATTEEVSLTN